MPQGPQISSLLSHEHTHTHKKKDELGAVDKGKTAIEIKEGGIDKREVLVESTGANQ